MAFQLDTLASLVYCPYCGVRRLQLPGLWTHTDSRGDSGAFARVLRQGVPPARGIMQDPGSSVSRPPSRRSVILEGGRSPPAAPLPGDQAAYGRAVAAGRPGRVYVQGDW